MATQITVDGALTNDESAGLQDNDILFSSLSADFRTYLAGKGLTDGDAAARDDMISITADANTAVGDLFFSNGNGGAFSGHLTNIQTTSGSQVWLHSDPLNSDIVLATTSATPGAGTIVAAFNLVEGTDNLSARIEMVTFEPVRNPDPTKADDDSVDWGVALGVTATTSLRFSFDNLESGKFTWVAVGSDNAGLMVTGSRLNLNTDGTRTNTSDAVNTSQGGAGATIGVDNQMFGPGESAIFTLVTGLDPLQGTAGQATGQDVDQIQYDGYINTNSATVFISQKQGGGLLSLNLSVSEAGGGTTPEEGSGYATNAPAGVKNTQFTDDYKPDLQSVTIMNGTTEIGTWTTDEAAADASTTDKIFLSGTAASSAATAPKVTIVGNQAQVVNVNSFYSITLKAVDGETFNRFELESTAGKFDIGNIDILQGTTVTTPTGLNLRTDDDGPTLGTGTVTAQVDEDELPGGNTDNDATLDSVLISDASLATTVNAGADGLGSFSLDTTVAGTAVLTSDGAQVYSHGAAVMWANDGGVLSGVVGDRTVFTLTDVDGGYLFDLQDQIDHAASGDEGLLRLNLTEAFRATDGDGDSVALSGNLVRVDVENDVPVASLGSVSKGVAEDDLAGGNPGGASPVTATYLQAELLPIISGGADQPVTISLSLAAGKAGTAVMTAGTSPVAVMSKGAAVLWAVDATTGAISGMAGARTVFTIVSNSDGSFTTTLLDQVDHSGANNDADTLAIDLSPAFSGVDYDGDSANPAAGAVVLNVENDLPIIQSQIESGMVDFAQGSTLAKSLNGRVGGDDDDDFIIDQYTDLAGFTETLSNGDKTLTYSIDGKAYYQLDVDNAASTSGHYTFTVLENAPETKTSFDFNLLPSGQNLFGVIAGKNAAGDLLPDGIGLLVIGSDVRLNSADGTFTQASNTLNSSQGGGGVTIGNTNQMMDPGEAMTFVFLDNPDDESIAGVGLNQNNADDADTIGFKGTQAVMGGEVEVVQVQGGGARSMTLSAYDLPTTGIATNDDAAARAFADDTLKDGNVVYITEGSVKIFSTITGLPVTSAKVTYNKTDGIYNGTVTITGFTKDSTISYATDAAHDAVKVFDGAGKWDLGGFNVTLGQDTPDALLNFSVLMKDNDGDSYGAGPEVLDDFSIVIDGTGIYNNNIYESLI